LVKFYDLVIGYGLWIVNPIKFHLDWIKDSVIGYRINPQVPNNDWIMGEEKFNRYESITFEGTISDLNKEKSQSIYEEGKTKT